MQVKNNKKNNLSIVKKVCALELAPKSSALDLKLAFNGAKNKGWGGSLQLLLKISRR